MKNKNIRIWDTINKHKGNPKHENKEQILYDEDKSEIPKEEWKHQTESFWKSIYKKTTK